MSEKTTVSQTEPNAKFIITPEFKGKTFTWEQFKEIFKNNGEYLTK